MPSQGVRLPLARDETAEKDGFFLVAMSIDWNQEHDAAGLKRRPVTRACVRGRRRAREA
jgi:hypothetical protein